MDRPTLISLTPVKNEAWILELFLQCTSTWADHIVVADQQSEDDTRAIAARFPKVHLIDNPTPSYDEAARQRLLIDAARAIPVSGKRVLVALDADEVLSANWMRSAEWDQLCAAPPGTVLRFQWVNVSPGVERGWVDANHKPFGFVDDGTPHRGYTIHSPRVPVPPSAPSLDFREVKVLHYQYADWQRMKSKQRWYQCWEALHHPEKRPVDIYRQYHHMDTAIDRAAPLRSEWLAGYEARGIDVRALAPQAAYPWDREVARWLREHGTERFRKLAIWDHDWTAEARRWGHDVNGSLGDPRSALERGVHQWLSRTQRHAQRLPVRAAQKVLRVGGW